MTPPSILVALQDNIQIRVVRPTNRDRANRNEIYLKLRNTERFVESRLQEEFAQIMSYSSVVQGDPGFPMISASDDPETIQQSFDRFLDADGVITELWIRAIEQVLAPISHPLGPVPLSPEEVTRDPNS